MFCDLENYEPFEIAALPEEPEADISSAALRQLRDCGCVRVAGDRTDLIGLHDEGLAEASPAPNGSVDYRITDRGRDVAAIYLED